MCVGRTASAAHRRRQPAPSDPRGHGAPVNQRDDVRGAVAEVDDDARAACGKERQLARAVVADGLRGGARRVKAGTSRAVAPPRTCAASVAGSSSARPAKP